MVELTFTNPLGRTLAYYEFELGQTLDRAGIDHRKAPTLPVEGLPGPRGKATMLANAVRNVRRHRNGDTPNLQVWTSLGLLEAVLWRSRTVTNYVALHDPVPLRRQIGFDPVSQKLASARAGEHAPVIMVHSDDALREARKLLPRHRMVKTLLPVVSDQIVVEKSDRPSVVVAGQYKPERDVALLAGLGPLLEAAGVDASIYGRGWPDIPGWRVHRGFIEEDELDRVLGEAWAVLLPYRLYFQSAIATRALERGTVTVSPRTSFAADLLGGDSPMLVDDVTPAAVTAALQAAFEHSSSVATLFDDYRRRVDESWRSALGRTKG